MNTAILGHRLLKSFEEFCLFNHLRSIRISSARIKRRMESLKEVDIDEGKFKYVLIRVTDGETTKHLVRGYKWASYHADVFEHVEKQELKPLKKSVGPRLSWSCPGGGRILHQHKSIKIYGYSQGFGRPDHSISCDLVKKAYPDYESITWSDEGY